MWEKTWFKGLMFGLGGFSIVLFVATLIAIPILVVRIPCDYFTDPARHNVPQRHPVVHWLLVIGKNVAGGLLVLMGVIMLVAPGQGILTMLVGLTLMNFPGKYCFERWLVTRRPVHRAIDWLRGRAGVPPLVLPTGKCTGRSEESGR